MASYGRSVLVWVACFTLLGMLAETVLAQFPARLPRTPERTHTADEFLQRLFGEEDAATRAAVEKVPISLREERQAGQSALQPFLKYLERQGIAVEKRGTDIEYVRELVDSLRPRMSNAKRYRKINVLLADSARVDARSFPGGTIVVFRGLIEFCESEAALVGILGHELAHIDRGHQLYHLRRWKYAQQTWSSGFDPRRMMATTEIMAKMFMRPFRPKEEAEADSDGARWAFELGYDASEMANVFLRLSQQGAGRDAVRVPFLQSHPANAERTRAINEQYQKLRLQHLDAPRYVGRKNIRQRTTRAKQEFAD